MWQPIFQFLREAEANLLINLRTLRMTLKSLVIPRGLMMLIKKPNGQLLYERPVNRANLTDDFRDQL